MNGSVRVAAACGWVDDDDETVYVAALPDGPPLVLEGSGALVWRVVLGGGTVEEAVEQVAAAAGESTAAVAAGVRGFVDDLVAAGVLEPVDPSPGPAGDD